MGRFKAGTINERKFTWGKVIFSDIYHITVETPSVTAIFHRYGAPKGHYTESWSRFRKELMRRDLEDIYEIYRYANRFDITHFVKEARLFSGGDAKVKSKEDNGQSKKH